MSQSRLDSCGFLLASWPQGIASRRRRRRCCCCSRWVSSLMQFSFPSHDIVACGQLARRRRIVCVSWVKDSRSSHCSSRNRLLHRSTRLHHHQRCACSDSRKCQSNIESIRFSAQIRWHMGLSCPKNARSTQIFALLNGSNHSRLQHLCLRFKAAIQTFCPSCLV